MARISRDKWNKAKAYFEAGKSLNFIHEKLGIGKSSISEKAKKEKWEKKKTEPLKDAIVEVEEENRTLNEKKRTVTEQLSTLEDYEIEVIGELVEDETKLKSLLTNATALNLIRINQALQSNKKLEKIGMGEGMQVFEEVGLGSGDYKNLQEAIDKASITLGINQRHAPKAEINNNNTNGQQTNIEVPEIEGYSVEVITPEEVEQIKAQQIAEDD